MIAKYSQNRLQDSQDCLSVQIWNGIPVRKFQIFSTPGYLRCPWTQRKRLRPWLRLSWTLQVVRMGQNGTEWDSVTYLKHPETNVTITYSQPASKFKECAPWEIYWPCTLETLNLLVLSVIMTHGRASCATNKWPFFSGLQLRQNNHWLSKQQRILTVS